MNVAVLWIELTGYLNACLRELAARPGVELFVARTVPAQEAPFAREQFSWIDRQLIWRNAQDLEKLESEVETFCPDVIVIAGWAIPAYRRVAKAWRGRAVRVLTMDNCWSGTFSQWIGCLTSPFFVRKLADAIWVPGERQAAFAHRLGFQQSQILHGLYCCDYSAFASVRDARKRLADGERREFVFIGRLIERKGVATLVSAYRTYRTQTQDPWPLVCYGAGPLRSLLEGEPGIRVEGFVQPYDLPARLSAGGCLVLPSITEPWALVVQEAAAAGLLILASGEVGATAHLVQPNYNGFIFDAGDDRSLAHLFHRVSHFPTERLEMMSDASTLLAQQFTPMRWANTLVEHYQFAHEGR